MFQYVAGHNKPGALCSPCLLVVYGPYFAFGLEALFGEGIFYHKSILVIYLFSSFFCFQMVVLMAARFLVVLI